MKLEQIRYLLEINRVHSISAAARSLHIGQTTLSAIVKGIEEEVGFSIFQRAPNGVTTTPMGKEFMTHAWEIEVKYEELMTIKRRKAGGVPAIKVLISPSIASCLSLQLSEQFSKFDLNINLIFDETQSQLIEERLLGNAGYIGLTYLTEQEIKQIEKKANLQSIKIERLAEDQLYLLVHKDHHLAHQPFLSLKDLTEERIVSANRVRDDKIVGTFLNQCKRVTRFDSFDLVLQAVARDKDVGIVPGLFSVCSPLRDRKDYFFIPIQKMDNENRMFLCLLINNNREMRYQEKILLACIHEYFQELNYQINKLGFQGGEEAQ